MKKLVFTLLMLAHGIVLGGDKTLTAADIVELLSGNTAVGTWIDHDYRQYFGDDGQTIYAQKGQRSALGRWRVNRTRDHYESWWERSDWGAGFSIAIKDGVYYWVSSTGSTEPQAFELVEGSSLLFDDRLFEDK